ncbi:hypothetical protein N9V74_05525 [Alteromonas sp.]|nr:hypothetical protein [Alteromonas sp.]
METKSVEENIEQDTLENSNEKNETLTTELHFELLKQYTWLASATIGAIVVLVQLKAVEVGADVYIPLTFLGSSILICISGQDHIVDALLKGKNIFQIAKILKLIRFASLLLLGTGIGYFIASLF